MREDWQTLNFEDLFGLFPRKMEKKQPEDCCHVVWARAMMTQHRVKAATPPPLGG